jgi:hypothetical protein
VSQHRIKSRGRSEKIFEMVTSSGNQCDVFVMARGARTLPFKVNWEHYPPSERDTEECEDALQAWAQSEGVQMSVSRHLLSGERTIEECEEINRRFDKAMNAENN